MNPLEILYRNCNQCICYNLLFHCYYHFAKIIMYIICGLIIRPQIILGKYLISQGNNYKTPELDYSKKEILTSSTTVIKKSGILAMNGSSWNSSDGYVYINDVPIFYLRTADSKCNTVTESSSFPVQKNDIVKKIGICDIVYIPYK